VRTLVSDLLRVAKRARRVDTLHWATVDSYADLLCAARPSILWLADAVALKPNSHLLFPELANDEVHAEHFREQPQPAGVGLACFKDAVVSGSSLVGSATKLYRLGPAAPLYVDQILSQDPLSNDLPVGNRRLLRRTKRDVSGLSVLLTHWNSAVYGHWLLESMPKLLLLHHAAAQLPTFSIVLPRGLPGWVTSWIELVLPGAKLEIYDERKEYLQCETLLIPTVAMHPEHFFHPMLSSLLEEVFPSASTLDADRRKLYVTRTAPSRYRKLANQSQIEEIATQEGLALFAPETLPIADQIRAFASADLIVGEFGSAMHGTLFSPSHAKVLCLNWINGMQSRIAQLKRQKVGYVLPSDGTAVKYVPGSAPVDYHIDAQTFRNCLRQLTT
jgi:hypothetical protein